MNNPAVAEPQEEDLDRAIEELRGVLHDSKASEPTRMPAAAPNTDLILNIPVEVQIVLGSAEMPVADLMTLQKGSTVALDRKIGEPVDVVVNGRRIARGEITVLEGDPTRFGIKLIEVIAGNG